ncbi:hypothetical protein CLV98_12211 [Dyadobacter jejuensis]|uniref:Uncharacterized protein n=1 Tax=Dyadobacter jejuensis TaxID=1082580 RepID=A0A316A789_9BACT|nr:hypothetical protein CLV98_12211 [Dyadobacter jejuensis]
MERSARPVGDGRALRFASKEFSFESLSKKHPKTRPYTKLGSDLQVASVQMHDLL